MISKIKAQERLFSEDVIAIVGPTYEGITQRDQIISWIKEQIEKMMAASYPGIHCSIFSYGSVPLRTFLADSDIDLCAVLSSGPSAYLQPSESHSVHIGYSTSCDQHRLSKKLHELSVYCPAVVTSVQIVSAEVQVIKMQCNSVPIDITLQQVFSRTNA